MIIKIIFSIIVIITIIICILFYYNINKIHDKITDNSFIINEKFINSDGYNIDTFTNNGTIRFDVDTLCDVLIVAGGGAGGNNGGWEGGGGGGGGCVGIGTIIFKNNITYSIKIGAGGINAGNNGENSSISGDNINVVTYGGGGGGWQYGGNGGSGGGGSGYGGNFPGGTATKGIVSGNNVNITLYGNNGGYGYWAAGGSGGGGAGGGGGTPGWSYNFYGANGGSGIFWDITKKYYGGGGGGAKGINYGWGGSGGIGGGGNGGSRSNPTNGQSNTGGGGGGGSYGVASGGSGIVVLKYKPIVLIKNDYGETVLQETILTKYELIKYPLGMIDTINNITGTTNNYTQTFIANNIEHTVMFSSYNTDFINATPLYLFDGNINNVDKSENKGGYFSNEKNPFYAKTTGVYIGPNSFNGTRGEWVSIEFQKSFILKKYGFIAKANYEVNAPGCWILYALKDNTYRAIDTNLSNPADKRYFNINNTFTKSIDENILVSNKYVFVFTELFNTSINNYKDNNLNFIEILLYGMS